VKERSLILAIDFDGTIVHDGFPGIGEPLPDAIRVLRRLQDAGHRLVLWTCREDELERGRRAYLTEAVDFCRSHGIEFVSINTNRPSDDFRSHATPRRKVYADLYIDDRGFGGFAGWTAVERAILGGPS
jgi:tagatose-1,6-bisphosphate aldolase